MLTPEKLNQAIADRKAAEAAASCTQTQGPGARSFVFEPAPGKPASYDMMQLLGCRIVPNPAADSAAAPERLTVRFSTADVVICGAQLAYLCTLISEHRATQTIRPSRTPAADPVSALPWIASIAIEEFDQPSAAGAPTNPPLPRNLEP